MKHIVIALFLVFFSTIAVFSQTTAGVKFNQSFSGSFKDEMNRESDFSRNSYSYSYFSADVFLLTGKPEMQFRLLAGIRKFSNNYNFQYGYTGFQSINSGNSERNGFAFAPGILTTIGEQRIKFYSGAGLIFERIGKAEDNFRLEYTNSFNEKSYSDVRLTSPAGFTAGFGFFTGIFYTLAGKINIGAECGLPVTYTRISGKYDIELVYSDPGFPIQIPEGNELTTETNIFIPEISVSIGVKIK
jgi:hypothetical protein